MWSSVAAGKEGGCALLQLLELTGGKKARVRDLAPSSRDDGGEHLWCDGGGGSANLQPSGELSRHLVV